MHLGSKVPCKNFLLFLASSEAAANQIFTFVCLHFFSKH